MRHCAAHPPPGPQPPPGQPPGPYDPPNPPGQPQSPPRRSCYAEEFRPPKNLKKSDLYPGMKAFHPEKVYRQRASGTPIRAIISHR